MLDTLPRYLYIPQDAKQEETDVVIAGGGIAGLTAALQCGRHKRALLVMKNTFPECNTYYAQGGIAAALPPHDSPMEHFKDTLRAGNYFCNKKHLKILTSEAPSAIDFLIKNGVKFDKDRDGFSLAREGGHYTRRILRVNGDGTGQGLVKALKKCVLHDQNIKVVQNTFLVDILTKDNHVTGVILKDKNTFYDIKCQAVIIATGGYGGIFSNTTNPQYTTGDGIAAAFRAGAQLSDLEFIQFHPTAFHHPKAPGFLISEAVRGEGGVLRNPSGERFMLKVHQDGELAPRDVVARAIFKEISATEYNHVYLDVTHLAKEFLEKRFPQIFSHCLQYGVDISKEWIPVVPSAHYTIGGIITDSDGTTTINGLYAVGEAACTGVHGANRLASNSLLEGVVFGLRAGIKAAEYCSGKQSAKGTRCLKLAKEKNPASNSPASFNEPLFYKKMQHVKQLNSKYLGLVRNERDLLKLLRILSENCLYLKLNSPDTRFWEFQNMLLLSYLSAYSALVRKESRGVHYRSDYPEPNSLKIHYVADRQGIEEVII
ncbi:MAG: nadB [Clostridiales bacterium]|jgi:L-aspartate oxidase|nr:nadB [Clostridiales bacterium]